jgi:hypothetical protein
MPVFVKDGGIVATRTDDVANDVQNPLTKVTLDVASGAPGHFALYEDAGTGRDSATTPIDYADSTLTIGAQQGDYAGRVASRAWTLRLHGVGEQPLRVTVDGADVASSFDAATHTLTVTTPSRSTDAPTTIAVTPPRTSASGSVGGSVPATLSLSLGAPASFGALTPGVEKSYAASTTATVTSTAGDAALSVSDPGHLRNGSFSLPDPLRVSLSKASWTAPVANDPVAIAFSQHIGASDPLRTGTYAATLTFTLSTTSP